ncbi:MAG: DUF5668 domain-containing protein [Bacteroidota bacterium]
MKNEHSKSIIGLLLITVGVLWIADNFSFIPYEISRYIFTWQSILIVIGIVFISSSKDRFVGFLLIFLGIMFLLKKFHGLSFGDMIHDFWPVILILFGLSILFGKKDRHKQIEVEIDEESKFTDFSHDAIDEFSIFGSLKKNVVSQNFRGGKITTILGASIVDLRNSKLASGRQVLDLMTFMGGVELILPSDWKVVINVVTLFAGMDDQRRKMQQPHVTEEDENVLVIKGLVIFGAAEIKS